MRPSRVARTGSLLLVAVAAACGRPAPGEPPAPRAPAVGDAEVPGLAEILRLEDRREYDADRLGALLEHPNAYVRGSAALAVGRIGDPAGAPLLRAALADSAASVRADAAFALGLLGDTAAATIERLAALLRTAGAPGSAVPAAVEAAGALGRVGAGSATASAALVEAVRPPARGDSLAPPPAPVVQEALLAVWRLPRSEAAVDAALARLSDDDAETRWRAAYALMRMGSPRAAAALRAALDADGDHRVRELAARGLRAAVADSAGIRAGVRSALLAALGDPHPHVRVNALRALGGYREPGLADSVAPLLRSDDANVAIAAAQTLGELGAAAADPLQAVARDAGARLALRGAALSALFRVAPERALPHAERLARSGEWLDRFYAAGALAAGRWTPAEPLLRTLADDPDDRVAAAALDAAVQLAADSVPAAYPLYLQGVARSDAGVRAAALRGLERRADPADLPVLLDAYERARTDTGMNDAALAAVDALGALARKGVPVAPSFFLRFPAPADPVVRERVAARLGEGRWGPARPFDTGRDSAFYLRVARELLLPAARGEAAPRARILTPHGAIVVELLAASAPLTVHSFLELARSGYFDGGRWHRVVPNFVLQDGDPRGDGSGGPGYSIRDEINRARYLRGAVGMALAGPDTGGSQFFITHSPQPHLDGGYTVFGRVVEGMEAADRVVQDDPILRIEVGP